MNFGPGEVPAYRELVAQARVEILSVAGGDEDAYLAAGRRVVDVSEIMVAVWNGEAAKARGGTADVVAYALEKRSPVVHINPSTRRVSKL